MASNGNVRACIFGATGYTGIELVGLLARDPSVELLFATSESYAGQSLADIAPGARDMPLTKAAEASGASGQGVQNMNAMCGLPELRGLPM